jgi:hypothetical protein
MDKERFKTINGEINRNKVIYLLYKATYGKQRMALKFGNHINSSFVGIPSVF